MKKKVTISNIGSLSIRIAMRFALAITILTLTVTNLKKEGGGNIWFWISFFLLLIMGTAVGFITGRIVKFRFDEKKRILSPVWDKRIIFALLPLFLIRIGIAFMKHQESGGYARYITDFMLLMVAGLLLGRILSLVIRIHHFQKRILMPNTR